MPETVSGTQSADDRKPDLVEQDRLDQEAREAPAVSVLTKDGWVDVIGQPGRAEDGFVPPVAPERGE